jgi:hypothetical protein
VPAVNVGEPRNDKEQYRLLESEGIKVYIAPTLRPTDKNPRIELSKFLFFKQLKLSGYGCQ